MSAVLICLVCLSTTADAMFTKRCFDGDHDMVEAVVTECPHARRDVNGSVRHQWRVQANRSCVDGSHHPLLCQHVSAPFVESPDV